MQQSFKNCCMDAPVAQSGLTTTLVERALNLRFDDIPGDARRVARDCLTDWLGCTLAGLDEPASVIVSACTLEEGGLPQTTLFGRASAAGLQQAALINGTASHALDYDDVHLALPGHASVALIPGLLALAEHRGADARQFITAFVAGYETACRIGTLLAPSHYASGFHATATVGCLGAAVACAHLLGLSPVQTAHALGTAATQAAGLKAMFGTMAKPLHAGMAAQAGLRAALLAQKGFTSRVDAIECQQGFAETHGSRLDVEHAGTEPPGGFHILGNLFKFHAACFSTHSTIEAVAMLCKAHGLLPDQVVRIDVHAGEACSICNIPSPTTALQAKFSLRAAAAFALLGIDTSRLQTWELVTRSDVQAALARVQVHLAGPGSLSTSTVVLHCADERVLERTVDVGIPLVDKAAQSQRVAQKFAALAQPVVGAQRSARILDRLQAFDSAGSVAALAHECR